MSIISMLPRQQSGNVYTILLYRALEKVGITYEQIPLSLIYLLRHKPLDRFHYLHFHWPENFFEIRPHQPHKLFGLKGFIFIKAFWLLAKMRGYRIIWTVHEVEPHDLQRHHWIHDASRRLLWRLADIVFSHTPEVMEQARSRWGDRQHTFTIPIGSYEGAYEDRVSHTEARARLGIPEDAFTFTFLGNIQPFKGLEHMIAAHRALLTTHPQCHLLIAGRAVIESYARELQREAEELPNVHLSLGYVPDEEVQYYMRAADCFVAPYRYVQTCSAIYLALAFELPIIITSEGNVAEFETHSIGIFMRDNTQTEAAMRRLLEMSTDELAALKRNTQSASQLYSWQSLKMQYLEAFRNFEASQDRTSTARRPDPGLPHD